MPAFIDFVVVDELGGYARSAQLRGAGQSSSGKNAHGGRDNDAARRATNNLRPPNRDELERARIRQPSERDVVEDVVAREAFDPPAKTRANIS